MSTEPLEVPIVLLGSGAVVPCVASPGDAGVDLRSTVDLVIDPGGHRAIVPTGVAVAIPAGYAGFIQPRSGLAAKHGVTVLNSPGLIDSGYRGELKVVLVNTDPVEPFVVSVGDRIAQLVIQRVVEPVFVEVTSLDDTVRGAGGFGHTGRR
ncbi:MAG TPA: dUTP diphosphatase [Microthrixaceae bacterium]|nr:dUTP diphosphatase [Microthrixaceae bacterium]HQF93266.1 dUTP diphosphatase [Microthrixaceae bacterium]